MVVSGSKLRGCVAALLFLQAAPALAAATKTELAGNSLSQYPFFEHVKAFNVDQPVKIAIDPTRFPAIAGDTCDIYLVSSKSAAQWLADPSLTDVTPGGMQTAVFSGANIQANSFQVTNPSQLNANAGLGLGVGYDVVLDCDQNGQLGDGDYIDGMNDEAGLYVVHDTSAAGPEPVTEQVYNLDPGVAGTFGIPAFKLGEDLYFPSNIASMGRRPLVVISRGNGHNFQWYDHIGMHLASYGYVVMSHDNNTEPGPNSAATTTLGHTDAFIDQAESGAIAGGALVGHIDSRRIVWIGHSRGAEGVAIAYDRLFDAAVTPTHFSKVDVRLISSMLPTDFEGTDVSNPHDANYHLWTAAGDSDVNGSAGDICNGGSQICQTFHLVERATRYRQSTVVQGTGHGWFHNEGSSGAFFTGPCSIGPTNTVTHQIQLGYFLPLIKYYVDGNIPALDFLTRQYESFHPIGVSTANPCVVVTNEYRNGAVSGNFVVDDYQTQPGTGFSSSGGMVDFDVEHLTEGRLDDNNIDFVWADSDPFNGATQAVATDTSQGVVFDWTDTDRFYEWQVPLGNRNFTGFRFLSLRGAQGTRHPNTLDETGDLTFTVTLRDGAGVTSSINIGAYGGGLEEPYQRSGGWHNEMETIRIRITDFLNNGSALDLNNIAAIRLNFGPSFGSAKGRIVVDDVMLSGDVSPLSLQIIEPTTARPALAGTSEGGSRVLVRVTGGIGLDLSGGNMTVSVAGVALIPAQIPTPATRVGDETWIVIAPGARPNGCYDLAVSLILPAGTGAAQPQSLCYNDNETRRLDRVIAIDQTNSMNRDGGTGLVSTAKMDAARAGGKFFVDLSNPLDRIGVVAFQRRDQDGNGTIVDPDELAEVRFPLAAAGAGATDQRPAARTAINAITPDTSPGFSGPETSPGAALTESRAMLDAAPVAGQEPHIILLTDGLENYAPFWSRSGPGSPLRPEFVADDIRVDTVGVGVDADDLLLGDIAAATGGEFRNLNEGSGSFFLLSRMADWYKSVDEDVRGEQRFHYAEGYPKASGPVLTHSGPSRIASFEVEPALDWMTVAFHANIDNAATVRLFAPGSGTPISAASPGVSVRSEPKHSVYRIEHPAAGTWNYVVEPHNMSAEFFAVASGPTLLAARVGPNQLARRREGDFAMPLRVWIADNQAVHGATVEGYVRRPDGVKDAVLLLDNGISMDGLANDGIYGLLYPATIAGAYYVHLEARGTSSAGRPFERYLSAAFVVPGQPKRPLQPGEGLPGQPNPGGHRCGCESEARVTIAVFAGITLPHGALNVIADPSTSFGLKPAINLPGAGGPWSLGLYLGRDNFAIAGGGGSFHLTHLSPEIEFAPWKICPRPAVHVGAGAYWDGSGNTKLGYNLGASLAVCLSKRVTLLTRYDYRSVNNSPVHYSTLQLGLRFNF